VLEFRALDRDGRVLSQTTTRIQPRTFAGDVAWPFEIALPAPGGEARYALRVAAVTWRGVRGMR